MLFYTRKLGIVSEYSLGTWLSVGLGHIKPQPGPEVASNLNDPYSQGFPTVPQPGPEVANRPNDLYTVTMT